MPHSKEEEDDQNLQKMTLLKKRQNDLGKVIMKVMSTPIKGSKKKRIGRKGQQVQ